MPGSFRLFRIAGISIEINVSWLIILVLLTASLAIDWFPTAAPGYGLATYWSLGLLAALLLFASVLVHELAHSLVARSRGLPVKSITLFVFGGVSDIEREPQGPGVEFQMAFAGPLASLIIGAVAFGAGLATRGVNDLLAATLYYLGFANLLLAGFNLIPGFPLDGGRVLRSIVWKATGNLRTATLWAARVGQVVAYLLILLGVWRFFAGDLTNGIWFGFIGWFLLQAAQAENSQVALESVFKGVTVGQLMSPPAVSAQGDATLQLLVDSYVLPRGVRSIPVLRGDVLTGLITLQDIRRVPREHWPEASAESAMIPLSRLHLARPDESLNDALPRMAGRDVNQLPVVDGTGRLVGMLSRDAIMRYVEIRRGLGIEGATAQSPAPQPPQLPVTG